MKKERSTKASVAINELIGWLIAVAILAILIIGWVYLNRKGISAIDYIKNLLKFR